MASKLNEKKKLLKEKNLCLHCLGRQFAQLGHGLENYERGAIVKKENNLSEEDFKRENIPEDLAIGGECKYCQGVFEKIEYYTDMVIGSFDRYELETFLIGIRPPEEAVENEELLWEETGIEHTEPLKTELSRLIGKNIEQKAKISVDFKRPNIMAVVDMREGKDRVELQVNSVLIYGQYNKYSREIPQTEWHCRKCRGRGCDECDWTGKQYPTSVQEEIQEPFVRESKATEAKFHGGGREDVDAKCFGKREFILELIEPINRKLDLKELTAEVNQEKDKVEIFEVEYTYKDKIEEVKNTRTDKEYLAKVETDDEITEKDLEKLKVLETTIEQRTPERVTQRRADKVRKRQVYNIETQKTGEKTFDLKVKAEAGTYIKELIHGDKGRTQPSVTGTLETQAKCTQLDIIWVEKVHNN